MSTTKPTCAVRGVLHGGRAMCGAIGVGSDRCHSSRPCQHKLEPVRQPDPAKTCLGCGAKQQPDGTLPCRH